MLVFGYSSLLPSTFHSGQQFFPQCRRLMDDRLAVDGFSREISRWLYHHFGVKSCLTTDEYREIYDKVVLFGESTQVECLLNLPSFVIKKLQFQITMMNFVVNVRLLSEQIVDWIDVREDPFRPGHNLCRWPKSLDPSSTIINTDGSKSSRENRAGIGCMFRMHQGEPLEAYAAICDDKMKIHVIETWAVREGLRIAVARKLKVVLIGTDATIAVSMINTVAAAYSNLVNNCRINYHNYLQESSTIPIRATSPREDNDLENYVKLVVRRHAKWANGVQESSLEFLVKTLIDAVYFLEIFDGWGCRHIMREANKAADCLTKLAKDKEIVLVKYSSYTDSLLRIIENDAAETWYQREKPTPISQKCTKSSGWMLN